MVLWWGESARSGAAAGAGAPCGDGKGLGEALKGAGAGVVAGIAGFEGIGAWAGTPAGDLLSPGAAVGLPPEAGAGAFLQGWHTPWGK